MMKKLLLFALPLLAMLSVSCEKDNDKPYSGPDKLVKEIYLDGELLMSCKYNDDGKVSVLNFDGGNSYTYEYLDKAIVMYSENAYDKNKITFALDADGYIIKEIDEYNHKGQVSISERRYEYKNGYLSKIIDADNDYEYVFVWKNGNVYPSYVDLEYSDIVNITNIELNVLLETGCPNPCYIKHKGLSSTNLVKSVKSEGYTYQYKLDNDGAPIQMSIEYDEGGMSTYTITYVE